MLCLLTNNLKLIQKRKRPKIYSTILKKNKDEGLTLSDLKTYYKSGVIKTEWYWGKKKKKEEDAHRPMEPNREPHR